MPIRSALLSRLVLAASLPLAGCASAPPPPPPKGTAPLPSETTTTRPAPRPGDAAPGGSGAYTPVEPPCPEGQTRQTSTTPQGPVTSCMPTAVPGRPLHVAHEARHAAMSASPAWL